MRNDEGDQPQPDQAPAEVHQPPGQRFADQPPDRQYLPSMPPDTCNATDHINAATASTAAAAAANTTAFQGAEVFEAMPSPMSSPISHNNPLYMVCCSLYCYCSCYSFRTDPTSCSATTTAARRWIARRYALLTKYIPPQSRSVSQSVLVNLLANSLSLSLSRLLQPRLLVYYE
jgi:hypothetical protein